jgi:hypothetical protein
MWALGCPCAFLLNGLTVCRNVFERTPRLPHIVQLNVFRECSLTGSYVVVVLVIMVHPIVSSSPMQRCAARHLARYVVGQAM